MVLILTLFLSWMPCKIMAETMFEGAYKVVSDKQHVGYVLQRYEFDPKTKIFTSIYFLKTNEKGGNITESLKAQSNDKFQPLNYQYTNQTGEKVKMIDAKFNKEIMQLEITDGKIKKNETHKIPKGTFMSSFLGYMMLQKGVKKGIKFKYSGVAEEDGASYNGEAFVEGEEKLQNFDVFRIKNKFKGSTFISYFTKNGEILKTESPAIHLSTELQASIGEATGSIMLPHKSVTVLFGKVPTGKINVLNKKIDDEKAPEEKTSVKLETPKTEKAETKEKKVSPKTKESNP